MKEANKDYLHFDNDIIQKGIANNLISFNNENTRIIYNAKTEKSYNYKDPEEKIRASVFIKLVVDFGYNAKDIDFEVRVPRRTPEDLADIVVYEKGKDTQPYLVVECKKDGISDSQFEQAIEQVFGNANSLGAKYSWVVAGNTDTAFDVKNFNSMEREKNVISQIPVSYGQAPKYRFKKEKKSSKENRNSLKIVSREELIKTLEKCHDTVWQGGKLNPSDAFDEVSKILFCKLQDEKKTAVSEFYKFQVGTHEESSDIAERIHGIYKEGKEQDPNVFSENIKLEDDIIYKTVEHLQSININKTDLDSKGVAFERFMGDFFKGKMGQYFTPRNIVDFCVKMLFIKQNERVLDPACGSGGFLLHAMDLIRKKAEEDYEEEKEIYSYWHDFASKNLFGIEINEQIARVCKMNMIIHDDGHTNIISADSLDNIEKHTKINSQFKKENFDIILTNPPFGAKVLINEKKYLKDYQLGLNNGKERAAQSTEVLFIERCFEYLKEGGRMAIVLPDGILTNATLQYVRDFIMNNFKINAIVSIPQTAFSHYGAGVKCSLLFLTKSTKNKEDCDIFMAQAEYVGYDATGREIEQNDLNEIFNNYKNFIEKKNFKLNDKCFLIKFNSIKSNKRIDAGFNKNPYNLVSKYSIVKLKDCILNKGTYGANEPSIPYNEGDIRYIRISDIDENGNLKNDTIKTAKNIDEKYILNDNDFLFARTGSVGRTFLYKKSMGKSIYAGYLIKYILDTSKIYPEYLSAYCQTSKYWQWVKQQERPAVQSNINAEEYSSLTIPLPPLDKQKEIANIMKEANLLKEKLEKEADKLLSSIDEYLLKELGINLPKKETDLKNRISYMVKLSEIKGNRFDCEYHQIYYKKFENAIKNTKYKTVKLKEKIFINSQLEDTSKYKFINYIDLSCIEKEKGIIIDTIFMNKDFPSRARQKVCKGDLLVSTLSGSMKAIAIVEEDKENLIASTGFFVIKETDKDLLKYFLISILRTNLFQELLKREARGAIMSSINCNDFLNIEIPLPPIEIQQKIVNEINERKQKALRLQKEAKEILENAKSQAERIIF
ncbi:N-6 DNA methylase [uncultured Brachyspira sp.]|uniref:N-6 DNA methylase n=1 Tax=uncultured Brachyspira sp. TaxID=221953 RepID=UPI0027DBF869|nr:N-6 DNA methylase [uncultured Brachyspira sp.]